MSKKVISIIAVITLIAVLGICLVACGSGNYETYKKRLEDKGYRVNVTDYDGTEGTIEWSLQAGNINMQTVTVTKYATKAMAQAAADAMGDSLKGSGLTVAVSGSVLIIGTAQGVKDAK